MNILLVEDNMGDARLVSEAVKETEVPKTVHHVRDGIEAMAFLRKQDQFLAAPRPDLMLLDLNMPRMDGRAVLKAVKADPELRSIPVIVLTTSTSQEDIRSSYALSANSYISKPVALDDFVDVIRAIDNFWFRVANLPGTHPK